MHALHSKRLFVALGAAACPLLAAAAPLPQVDAVVHPWTATPAAAFTRLVAGELTGDGQIDAVMLDGSLAVFLESPGRHNSQVDLAGAVEDLCVVHGGTPWAQGEIVTVGAAGALSHTYSAEPGFFSATDIGGSEWVGAHLVVSGQVDGADGNDIVGVNAAYTKIIQRYQSGGAWVAGPDIAIVAQPDEIVLAQWDGDGLLDIVLRSSSTLYVYGSNGAPKAMIEGWGDGGALAVLSIDGAVRDCVAWSKYDSGTQTSSLALLNSTGMIQEQDLAGLEVVGMGVSDFDGDGDDDIFLSSRTERVVRHYDNQSVGAASSFAMGPGANYTAFDPDQSGLAATGNALTPALADFDADGDPDLLFALALAPENTQSTYLFHGTQVDEDQFKVSVAPEDGHLLAGSILKLQYRGPPVIDPVATHLRVRVWNQDSLDDPVQPLGASDDWFPLGDWPLAVTVPFNPNPTVEVYSVEVQIVFLDPSGTVVRAWPAYIGALSFDQDTIDAISASTGNPPILVQNTASGGGRETGGFVPTCSVSPFADPVPPPP